MALRDQVVELVLRARNMLSRDTDAAAASVESLAGNAEGLQEKLRALEDQGSLIKQFERASKSVDRTGAAYDRAQVRLEKLKAKLDTTGPLTRAQSLEFAAAERAVEKASGAYEDAQGTLGKLATEADKAGIDVTDLSAAQRANAAESRQAKRAIQDLNKEVSEGDGRLKRLGKSLAAGTASFVKWGAAAAGAAAAFSTAAIARLTTTQADLARQTLASAEAFGVSAGALQEWQYAAEQVGIGGEKTADILKDVSEKIGDAFATGGGEAAEVIERLNLNVEELVRLEPDQQILKIAQQLDGMPKSEQIQVLEALASDASLLLPLLDNNAAKLRELAAAAQERGEFFTDEELQRLADADAAFEKLKSRVSGFFKDVAVRLAPAFETLSEALDKALADKPELVTRIVGSLERLIQRTTEWSTRVLADTAGISARFQSVGAVLEGVGQLFVASFRGVQAFGAGAAEVAARFVYDWNRAGLAIVELRRKIGLASQEAVDAARFAVENAATSVQDLQAQAEGYQDKMVEAGRAAAEAFGRARDGARDAAAAVDEAAASTQRLGDSVGTIERLPPALDETAESAGKASAAMQQLSQQIAGINSRADASQAIADLTQTFDRGDITAQEYADSLQKVDRELVKVGRESNVDKTANDLRDAAGAANEVTAATGRTWKRVVVLGEEAEKTGDKLQQAAETGGGAFAIATDVIQGYLNKMAEIGPLVQQRFIELASGQKAAAAETATLEEQLDSLDAKITDIRQNALRTGDATGLGRMFKDLGVAAANAEKQYISQLKTVRDLTNAYESGAIGLRDYIFQAEAAARQGDLLNDQDLSQLNASIAAARQQMESFRESTAGTLRSLQDELDQLQGNTEAIELRRYQERIRELEDQLQYAEAVGDQQSIRDARKALDLAQQIRAEKERENQASAAERAARDRERQREQSGFAGRSEPTQRTSTSAPTPAAGGTMTLNLQLAGQPVGTLSDVDEREARALMDTLERAGLTTAG